MTVLEAIQKMSEDELADYLVDLFCGAYLAGMNGEPNLLDDDPEKGLGLVCSILMDEYHQRPSRHDELLS